MGSGVEGIGQSGVSTPKALPKIPVLKIHSLPTIHCYYYLDISSNIPALSGLYVLRSRFLKALTLSIFPYHVLSTHWWICSMHTLLGDGWIATILKQWNGISRQPIKDMPMLSSTLVSCMT